MKKQTIITLIVILLVGALLGTVVFVGLQSGTEQVVVPAVDIEAGETLTADNLKIITIPRAVFLDDIMYKNENMTDVLGQTALTRIMAGEPITDTKISLQVSDGITNGMDDPANNFAVTIPIPTDRPVVNIGLGDHVAMFATYADNNENIVTGLVGDKYKIVGIEEDEDGIISSIIIEVGKDNIAEVSHTMMNADYAISFVANGHEPQTIIGITHNQIIQKHIGSASDINPDDTVTETEGEVTEPEVEIQP